MTNKKWALSVALLLTVCALLFGCDSPGSQTDGTTPSVVTTAPLVGMHQLNILEEGPLYMQVGDTVTLTTDAPEELADRLTWTSSSSCVGITRKGVATAQAWGKATVTVEYHGFTDSIEILVVDELPTEPAETTPIETTPAETDPLETNPPESDSSDTEPVEPPTEVPTEAPTEPETEYIPPTVIIEAERSPEGYKPAGSYEEALSRTQNGQLSGYDYVPDQAPIISDYRPMQDGKYIKNNDPYYIDENTYVVVDAYGREVFRVYRGGAYITLEEVAAYVWAFGDIPANHATSKSTRPTASVWGKYLRVNHTKFSGNTSKYPYEPELPRISGCGGDFTYYEMDIGTTGTDCDPSYYAAIYNNGYSITRGAARIVYARFDRNGNKIIEPDEKHVFYTYNHYNDFQEYLNYYGGWGEMFGNITGGGAISSKYDYNPTPYVPVANAPIAARGARILPVLFAETYTAPFRMEATVLHCDLHRYRDMAA
ncbi:MAG: hypothetical protein IJD38_06070 [Clostridia bacterium]|nr:hypothetical protein [Clostridia bacterium]